MTEPVIVTPINSSSNGRVKKMAAVGGVLVLLLYVGPKVLGGGGGGGGVDPLAVTPGGVPSAQAPVGPGASAGSTIHTYSARDPFRALVSASVSDSGGTTTVPATVPDLSPAVDLAPLPGAGVPVSGPDGAPTTRATAPAPPPRPTRRFALLEVYKDAVGRAMARVRVDDAVHEVAVGDEFETSYRVVSLDVTTRCGQFLFGDATIPLCEGAETRT